MSQSFFVHGREWMRAMRLRRKSTCWALFIGAAIMDALCASRITAQDKLLDEVLAKIKETRASIRTMYAELESETHQSNLPDEPIRTRLKYWRSGEDVRVDKAYAAGMARTWLNGAEGKSLSPYIVLSTGEKKIGASKFARTQFMDGDVWEEIGLHFTRCGGAAPIEELLPYARSTPRVRRVKVDGQSLVRLNMEVDAYDSYTQSTFRVRFEIFIDPSRNYHVKRYTKEWGKSFESKQDFEVMEYLEFSPGRFIPVHIKSTGFHRDEIVTTSSTRLHNVRINEPVARELFVPASPPNGTVCLDEIRKVRYPVNEKWEQIGPETPHTPYGVPLATGSDGRVYYSQTMQPPRRNHWILWGSVAIVLVGSVLGVIRWFRRRRAVNA